MRRATTTACWTVAAVLVMSSVSTNARADHKSGGVTVRYPRVYGWTGTPYGPTQAHYQYQRQYGRAWHGYGGNSINLSMNLGGRLGYYAQHNYRLHSLAYGGWPTLGNYGYGFYSGGIPVNRVYGTSFAYPYQAGVAYSAPAYGYLPPAPNYVTGGPVYVGPNPFDNSVMREALIEENQRWHQPLVIDTVPGKPRRVGSPSTPEAQLRSLRAQQHGDQRFRQQDLAQARARYQRAIEIAPDRAEPRFRLAFALIGLGRLSEAVTEIRKGLQIDPTWPTHGIPLTQLYGKDNLLAKATDLHRVTRWVRQDIRNPDRLFLLGVMLHFDNDDGRADQVFEAAYRLRGGGEHLLAFLRPQEAQPEDAEARPEQSAPAPVPDAPDDPGIAPPAVIPPLPAAAEPNESQAPGDLEPIPQANPGPLPIPLPEPRG